MYSRIMVPLDGSPFSETALPYARAIAGSLAIPVELVEAFDALPPSAHHRQSAEATRRMLADVERNSRQYLGQVQEMLRSAGLVATVTTLPGAPARALVDWLVRDPEALVVMSTHGRGGIARWALGSVADKVLHSVPNPVLLIRGDAESAPADAVAVKIVLVPLDGSALSEESLTHAAAVAAGLGASITLIQVTGTADFYRRYLDRASAEDGLISAEELVQADSEDARTSLAAASRRLAQEFGYGGQVTVTHLQGQNPAEAIVNLAGAEPTMVVMTTHGRSGINRLVMGSVTDRVVRHANAPVLVVRRHDEPGTVGVDARASEGYATGFGNPAAQPA